MDSKRFFLIMLVAMFLLTPTTGMAASNIFSSSYREKLDALETEEDNSENCGICNSYNSGKSFVSDLIYKTSFLYSVLRPFLGTALIITLISLAEPLGVLFASYWWIIAPAALALDWYCSLPLS